MSDEPAAHAHALLERLSALLHGCKLAPELLRLKVSMLVISHADGRFTRLDGTPCTDYAAALVASWRLRPALVFTNPRPTEAYTRAQATRSLSYSRDRSLPAGSHQSSVNPIPRPNLSASGRAPSTRRKGRERGSDADHLFCDATGGQVDR